MDQWRNGVTSRLRMARAAAVETVYPRRCAGCGRRGIWVCDDCAGQLPILSRPWCERCGVPNALGPCHCADLAPRLELVRSVALYEGWLQQAIIAFKYNDEWSRADHLGQLLAKVVAQIPNLTAVVPVPLHPKRRRQRGYNQAELLAQVVARQLHLPVCDLLVRVKPTAQQVGLSALERHHNVADAFQHLSMGMGGDGRIVLIDDVVTTGSTLGACAEALALGGWHSIAAATLAREHRAMPPPST